MGHPEIDNASWLHVEPLLLEDHEGRPILVPVLKATFALEQGTLRRAEQQEPVRLLAEHWGEPESSSCKYESETAWTKPGTDVVLLGEAHAARPGDRESVVAVRVGALSQIARVVGDRIWFRSFLGVGTTAPLPFERMPLTWERAFGGHDPAKQHPTKRFFEPRNPVGRGFRLRSSRREETPLPNLENPREPLRRWGQTPAPVGFGYVGAHWQPRACLAGTYDQAWERDRKPLLPVDFDPRFFHAAPPALVSPSPLAGDEPVVLEGLGPNGTLSFRLPGLPPPQVALHRRGGQVEARHCPLDTVILDLLQQRVLLLWRCAFSLVRGPADVAVLRVRQDAGPWR